MSIPIKNAICFADIHTRLLGFLLPFLLLISMKTLLNAAKYILYWKIIFNFYSW